MVLPEDRQHILLKDRLKHDYRKWIEAARNRAGQIVPSAEVKSHGDAKKLQYLLANKAVALGVTITGRLINLQKDVQLPEIRSFQDWKRYFYPQRINNFVARASTPDDPEAHPPLIAVVSELVTTPPDGLETEFTDFASLFSAFFELREQKKPSARKKETSTYSAFISQDANYRELGLGSWAFAGKVPPYVNRVQDAKLDKFLSNTAPGEQLIVISGPAKSGKTRSVVEALKRAQPHSAVLWAQRDRGLSSLPAELDELLKNTEDSQPERYFVVIDDLQLYGLGSPHGLTSELLTNLSRNAYVIVTVQSSALKQWKLQTQQHKPTGQTPTLAPSTYMVNLLDDRQLRYEAKLTDGELENAIQVWTNGAANRNSQDAPSELRYWPEYLSATDLLISRIEVAEENDGYKKAFILALVDAFNLYPFGASEEQLKYLTRFHYRTISPLNASRENRINNDFESAMDWAAEPIGNVESISAILEIFFDKQNLDTDEGLEVYEREITYAINPSLPPRLYSDIWDPHHLEPARNSDALTDAACLLCGTAAYRLQNQDSAIRWWQASADKGSVEALINLGTVANENGDTDVAFDYLGKAASTGEPAAFVAMGDICSAIGDFGEAIEYHRKAAELGAGDGFAGLGYVALLNRDFDAAESAFTTAAGSGSENAFFGLGTINLQKQDYETAYKWYKKAALNGDSYSLIALSLIETHFNNLGAAEDLLKIAFRIDENPLALNNLGVLWHKQGSPDFSPAIFTQAFETGCAGAFLNHLGLLVTTNQIDVADALSKYSEYLEYVSENPAFFKGKYGLGALGPAFFTDLTEEARELSKEWMKIVFELASEGDEEAIWLARVLKGSFKFFLGNNTEDLYKALEITALEDDPPIPESLPALYSEVENPPE
ncbi:tetratricopeptide repeat protein [Varibaculum massiliense]|uniref:tetratricopeptide repeat protein n=1 Tax=Varibaculum massiliense TaxID=1852372 RepID=UPI00288C26A2|nr:tetratricopeptide repeat protein [Varibaculum massiliense]